MRVLCAVVCLGLLAALAGCAVSTSSPPNARHPAGAAQLGTPDPEPERIPVSRVSTQSGEPPTAPMLRLETGMHTNIILSIGVDAAQRYLATGSVDKTVRVWELASGRLLRTLRPPIGVDGEGSITAVALSPDGSTVAATGATGYTWDKTRSIYLFDRVSGRLRQCLTSLPAVIHYLVYSRDGAFLVATMQGTHGIRVYRSSDGAEVARDTEYGDGLHGADFDPSGQLVTTSADGFVRLYGRDFRLRVKRKGGEWLSPSVAFSPDGSRVAVASGTASLTDPTRVEVLSGQDLTPLYTPDITGVAREDLTEVAWSADGQWLYAASKNTHLFSRRWAAGGRGPGATLATVVLDPTANSMRDMRLLAGGGVVFGIGWPAWGVLDASGKQQRFQGPATVDFFRAPEEGFRLAPDGTTVQFGYAYHGEVPAGKVPARFAVHDRVLSLDPAPDQTLTAPVTDVPGLKTTRYGGPGGASTARS